MYVRIVCTYERAAHHMGSGGPESNPQMASNLLFLSFFLLQDKIESLALFVIL